ncbi:MULTISPECIES: hypothetical protein [Arthrobacter]|uniref:hypothetical protein n=1 Tax=Arthrobacter TaxID=1663 RepID=UPI000AD72C6D|nr:MULTISPECIES: hypothetical protein [Arthrobacter]
MYEFMAGAAAPITPGTYFGWGDVTIQSGNLVVIVVMLILFGLSLLLPFPGGKSRK